jgi:hypothetical protein
VSCKPITFCNVQPDTFECMKKKLEDAGIQTPPGNKGKLLGMGIVADFEWDGKCNLTILIKEKPFFVSCELAESQIKQFIIECCGS